MQACPTMGVMVTLGTLGRAWLLEPELALEQPLLLTTTTTSNSRLLYHSNSAIQCHFDYFCLEERHTALDPLAVG